VRDSLSILVSDSQIINFPWEQIVHEKLLD